MIVKLAQFAKPSRVGHHGADAYLHQAQKPRPFMGIFILNHSIHGGSFMLGNRWDYKRGKIRLDLRCLCRKGWAVLMLTRPVERGKNVKTIGKIPGKFHNVPGNVLVTTEFWQLVNRGVTITDIIPPCIKSTPSLYRCIKTAGWRKQNIHSGSNTRFFRISQYSWQYTDDTDNFTYRYYLFTFLVYFTEGRGDTAIGLRMVLQPKMVPLIKFQLILIWL